MRERRTRPLAELREDDDAWTRALADQRRGKDQLHEVAERWDDVLGFLEDRTDA